MTETNPHRTSDSVFDRDPAGPGDHFIAGLGRLFLITLDILIVNVAISLRIRPTGHE
jgi:hypothetical protein